MNSSLRSFAGLVVFGTAALASTTGSISPSASVCRTGAANGVFELPDTNQDGDMYGVLKLGSSNAVAYTLDATVVDVPSPCLSCVQGVLDGTLDDGVGPGPDYTVVGRYFGSWLEGKGQFEVSVFPVGSTTRVGRIRGNFNDSPLAMQPGHFSGSWRICD